MRVLRLTSRDRRGNSKRPKTRYRRHIFLVSGLVRVAYVENHRGNCGDEYEGPRKRTVEKGGGGRRDEDLGRRKVK